jgi:hypothetical protein
MRVEGIKGLQKWLDDHFKKYKDNEEAVVGYGMDYAIYVHENLEAQHPNGGQAKFLEQPATQLADDGTLAKIQDSVINQGGTLTEANLAACRKIEQESQLLVPVDTGALKGSSFVCLKKDEDAAFLEAQQRGGALMEQVQEARKSGRPEAVGRITISGKIRVEQRS